MSRLSKISQTTAMRRKRVRSVVSGTAKRPRLSVRISNRHISAQIIDDTVSKTLVQATTVGSKDSKGTMTDKAVWVGDQLAKKALAHKVKKVSFDRNGRLYHGRVKALADAARKSGLEF